MLQVKKLNLELNKNKILTDISFEIIPGEILSIIGKSGCGKSSLLKSIVGIHKSIHGKIFLEDQDITNKPIEEREMVLVFQDYSLFPHMTLEQNMDVANPDKTIQHYVIQSLDLVHLYGKYPYQMSSGEQQRCALARAIAHKPKVLLLDEPFSNIDAITTKSIRKAVARLLGVFEITTLMVTHDLEDVFEMSQRCMVIENGKISQIDSLKKIKTSPKSAFIDELFLDYFEYNNLICKIVK